MPMNEYMLDGVFFLSIATLFFASVTLCIRTSYKKKNDSSKCRCGWDGITYETTRDVKVEEDIEMGKKKTRGAFGGSTETNSEFNSDFNSESKR